MTIQARFVQEGEMIDWTSDAAYNSGDVIQLKDGRAAVVGEDVASGKPVGVYVGGIFKVQKTTSMVFLNGGRAYWDNSASLAHYKKVNDRDFYLGRFTADAASADTVCYLALNVDPPYDIDAFRDPCKSALAGTPAASAFGYPRRIGGAIELELTATSEAQKVDLMTVDGFDPSTSNAIVEFAFRVTNDGGSGAQDFSIGVADGTNATDFESVNAFVAIHLDGNVTAINAESDDNSTDVNPTDTTKTYSEGSAVANRKEVWMDFRDPADVQIYVDGVLVLPSSVFTAGVTATTLFLIAHLEKTTGTDVYVVAIDWLRCRLSRV